MRSRRVYRSFKKPYIGALLIPMVIGVGVFHGGLKRFECLFIATDPVQRKAHVGVEYGDV